MIPFQIASVRSVSNDSGPRWVQSYHLDHLRFLLRHAGVLLLACGAWEADVTTRKCHDSGNTRVNARRVVYK